MYCYFGQVIPLRLSADSATDFAAMGSAHFDGNIRLCRLE
jgi:hypothetical protein